MGQMAWAPVPVKCQASKLTLCHVVAPFGPGRALAVYAGIVAGYKVPVPGKVAEAHMDWKVEGVGTLHVEAVGPGLALVEKVAEQLELARSGLSGVGPTAEHYMVTVLERSLAAGRSANSLVHVLVHRY